MADPIEQFTQWYVDEARKNWNQSSPFLNAVKKEQDFLYGRNYNNSGGTMPAQEVTYGRLVRIPTVSGQIGDYRYKDVTVKDAKREAKALRKLARQIEKACR